MEIWNNLVYDFLVQPRSNYYCILHDICRSDILNFAQFANLERASRPHPSSFRDREPPLFALHFPNDYEGGGRRSGSGFERISRTINNGAVRLIAGRREKNTGISYGLESARVVARSTDKGGSIIPLSRPLSFPRAPSVINEHRVE